MSGFRRAQDSDDLRHTTGNMGMIPAQTVKDTERLAAQRSQNQDVWRSTAKLSQMKKELHQSQNMVVDSSNIKQVLS